MINYLLNIRVHLQINKKYQMLQLKLNKTQLLIVQKYLIQLFQIEN